MPTSGHNYHVADNADEYVREAAESIRLCLEDALLARGKASLLVSGGSSPKPVYEALSRTSLDWKNITVSLVDERWVPEGAEGSNASFIKETLLQNEAAEASFVPLVNDAPNAKDAAPDMARVFDKRFPEAVDVCVMGMGTDGHTASWFPRSETLDEALEIERADSLVWHDASGQGGGSGFDDRITVSLPIVMRARNVFLLIPGLSKKTVWEESADKEIHEAPVTTLRAAEARLHVYTHEGA